jgi:sugar phosphate isomerase/epimerase
MLSRRDALKRMGAIAAGAAAGTAAACSGESEAGAGEAGAAAGTAAAASMASPIGPIGVQLYTVRAEMTNGVESTLERVAAIGYEEVEFAGYFGHSPTEIREMLARTGLRSPATHIPPNFEVDAWSKILDDSNEIGHEYVVVASIPQSMRSSLDAWRETGAAMSRAGDRARSAGLQYAYHNHDFEFEEMEGRVAFDVFCEESDLEFVKIELDLFWIIHGGQDPIEFMDRWPGRIPLVHVKDRTAGGDMVDVGAGVIDWAGIFEHAENGGVEHFFVEHDTPDGPLRSIAASYGYMSRLRDGAA